MNLGLHGKSVLVLASSKGLGKAIAWDFAHAGAKVMLASRNEQELKQTAQEIRDDTHGVVQYQLCDVTDYQQIKALVNDTATTFGTIDVLVNNAGGPPAGSFDSFDDQDWYKAFELNLLSYVRAIREVIPFMRQQRRGHIVNIASSSFKEPISGLILSNTFRTGIVGLAKTLSHELAPDNILINTVGPGRIGTDRLAELDKKRSESLGISYEQAKAQFEAHIPLGRYGTPEEFAKLVVFLCSGLNTYITGQAILVDGGMTKAL